MEATTSQMGLAFAMWTGKSIALCSLDYFTETSQAGDHPLSPGGNGPIGLTVHNSGPTVSSLPLRLQVANSAPADRHFFFS